jgi:hypothetical protein
MWKSALAGAMALATMGLWSVASAQEFAAGAVVSGQALTYETPILTQSAIARFKAALRLSAQQEQYWPAVAVALRDLVRDQEALSSGMITRVRNRVTGIVLDAIALKRLAAAATPLVRSLDDVQKQEAIRIAHALGFGHLAAAF